jgi:hypothetical protein
VGVFGFYLFGVVVKLSKWLIEYPGFYLLSWNLAALPKEWAILDGEVFRVW